MTQTGIYEWSNVDQAAESTGYVNFLEMATAVDNIRAYKQRTFEMMGVKAGDKVLDIGCGAGDDVLALAQIVGPTGQVHGIDNSQTMIDVARDKVKGSPISIEFSVQDVINLNFETNSLDGCRADRVFQHLPDPKAAFDEVIRVVRPGGRVLIIDPDWETLVVDHKDVALTRKFLNYMTDGVQNGWMGRQLYRMFVDFGLEEVEIVALAFPFTDFAVADPLLELTDSVVQRQEAGIISTSEGDRWIRGLEQAAADGTFFCSLTGFMVCGKKPQLS